MAEHEPCTPQKLRKIINDTQPHLVDLNDFQWLTIDEFINQEDSNEVDADEVYPGIFVGHQSSATNIEYLKSSRITHVINAAHLQVHTNKEYYSPLGIKFLGLKLLDVPEAQISEHFIKCADFIDDALSGNGKVLVHCRVGISRSPTIVAAYLMLRKNFSAETSIRKLRHYRDIGPNNGFLQQLCDLENSLSPHRNEK